VSDDEVQDNVKGKAKVGDEDLSKPFKRNRKSGRVANAGMMQNVLANPRRFRMLKACDKDLTGISKIARKANEISKRGDFSKDSRIGDGRFGMVYIGRLSDRWKNHEAAIKRLDNTDHQGKKEFLNELRLISRFYHQNIISFIGYCDEGNEMILVYEYASNGILDHHLQDQNKRHQLPWPHRIQYALIIAKPK
nr:probable receptor-like protein kinase At5g59700 [Tanacetum cinerariifolium]